MIDSEECGKDYSICVGVIAAAVGVRGKVKIRVFTDHLQDIENFDEVFDDEGVVHDIKVSSVQKKNGCVVAKIGGVDSRNEVEHLCNKKLYVKRSKLPSIEEGDQYYHADLQGMSAFSKQGEKIGVVRAVLNYGAGDILEIYDMISERSTLYPFKSDFILEINLKTKCVVLEEIKEEEIVNDSE